MIRKGDMLTAGDRPALATSEIYVKMYYDDYDFELAAAGYEGGTACGVVDVVFTDNGQKATMKLSRVQRVLPPS